MGGGGTSATFSIPTTALAVVVLLPVVLVPPTKTHIDLKTVLFSSQYRERSISHLAQ